jgi:hypothetical protein
MRTKFVLGAAVGLSMLFAVPTQAHHAVQASVDIDRTVEVSAVLTRIDWINPHTWMHFDATLPDGTVAKGMMVESLGIAALRRIGLPSKSSFNVGETYQITFYPNRNGEPGGFMRKMVLPDGRVFETINEDPTAVAR